MIECYKFMFSSGAVYAGTLFFWLATLFMVGLIVSAFSRRGE